VTCRLDLGPRCPANAQPALCGRCRSGHAGYRLPLFMPRRHRPLLEVLSDARRKRPGAGTPFRQRAKQQWEDWSA
jgi:hypothetical protein